VTFAHRASAAVVNAVVPFIKPPEVDRSKEHVPRGVRQRLESDR